MHPDTKSSVLIVDDAPANLKIMSTILGGEYVIHTAGAGGQALQLAREVNPDLILLDIVMPGMDGYEVCRRLKEVQLTHDIPVVFLTSADDAESKQRAFELGAVDYVTKPFEPQEVSARVRTHIQMKQMREYLRNQNELLEHRVRDRTRELHVTQEATIIAMASLAETRDNETGNHLKRTQGFVKLLGQELKATEGFESLDDAGIELIALSAPLHDIGKVGIPDSILLKPGKLSAEEFEIMKQHTIYGRDAIARAEALLGKSSFLRVGREIAYTHQERWNGKGYPQGLAGDEIPVASRLMAVADVYDALIGKRVYKPALPHRTAVDMILAGAGTQFDPRVVAAFERMHEQFRELALANADNEEERRALRDEIQVSAEKYA